MKFSMLTLSRGLFFRTRILSAAINLLLLAALPSILAQEALVSGGRYDGTIPANGNVPYTFDATAGESVVLRVAGTNVVPRIDVFGPGGTSASAFTVSPGNRDARLNLPIKNTGTYAVTIGSYYANGTGPFRLQFAQIPGAFSVPSGDEGGVITNGTTRTGTIALGDFDLWSFSGNSGDGVQIRVGTTDVVPQIDLYGPDGALVKSAFVVSPGNRDVSLAASLTNSGTFTIVVSSYYVNGTGDYAVSFAKSPGDFEQSPGDDGGTIENGARMTGEIKLGDLDLWKFTATAGDSIQVRAGTTNFVPRLDLYGPDGTLIDSGFVVSPGNRDVGLSLRVTQSGTFLVVLSSYYSGGAGGYGLSFARAPGEFITSPGDDGGGLANGKFQTASLSLGDLDMWSFTASTGNGVQIRMNGTNFVPRLDLYGPDGVLVKSAFVVSPGNRDASMSMQVTNSGVFTIVASSYYAGGSGDYGITLARIPGEFTTAPGDEGGTLTNGVVQTGLIDLGDIDAWTFEAQGSESVQIRIGATNFVPRLDLYGPGGELVSSAFVVSPGNRDVALLATLTNSGTHTLLVSSYYPGNSGDYSVTMAHPPESIVISPGDEGGIMTNGVVYFGTNFLGDQDVWTFYGTTGDSNVFRIGTVDFTPWLRLYGPDGKLVKESVTVSPGNRTNVMSYVVTNSGPYTLVSSAWYPGQFGSYNIKQSRVPPDLNMPSTLAIDEGTVLDLQISAQDPDLAIKPLTFSIQGEPAGIVLTNAASTNAVIHWATSELDGPVTNTFLAMVTDTVNGKAFTRTNTFTLVVNEINVPPVLTVPGVQTIDELTPLNVSVSATDADIPTNSLAFSLIDPPAGMTIDPATGAISWTPTEAQGPSTNTITVVVTDTNPWAVNEQHMSATNAFTVAVREINTPPVLVVPADMTIDETLAFAVATHATDTDDPPNSLTYSLVSPPAGMTIDPASGTISWMPTEEQGPSTNLITVAVTDNNPLASNTKQLTATRNFTLIVREVHVAPQLTVPAEQTIDELATLNVSASATDPDVPNGTLSFALMDPPTGMTIDPASGAISWTPSEAQGASTNNISVIATTTNPRASNSQVLSVTNQFTVIVREINTAPQLTAPADQTIDELTPFTLALTATDSDQPTNSLSWSLLSPPEGLTINPATGLISWTPTEAQGPSTNSVTVVVTDSNPSAFNTKELSTTNSFKIVVHEVNAAPVVADLAPQSVHFGTLLSVQASATDEDLPANSLTYSLENAPAGMSIDPATKKISWTPTEEQLGSYTVTLRVADDGSPARDTTKTLQITVTGTGTTLSINLLNNLAQVSVTGDAGHDYELQRSSDLKDWTKVLEFPLTTAPYSYIDPDSRTSSPRFYRLKLLQ